MAREMAPLRGVKGLEDVEIEAKPSFEGRSVPEGLCLMLYVDLWRG